MRWSSPGSACGRALRRLAVALLIVTVAAAPLTPAYVTPVHAEPSEVERAAQGQIAGDPLVPGTSAIVDTNDGSCLRLRSAPSTSGERVDCIPQGRTALVLPATEIADGFRWQFVEWRGRSGWVADAFLKPYDGPPLADSCQAQTMSPGITGELPSQGGLGLVTWGGGTPGGIQTAAQARDCTVVSLWATRPDGGFVSYRFDVPAFVNQEWRTVVGDVIAAGTPLMIVCQRPGAAVTVRSTPSPAPSAPAPIRTGSQQPPSVSARAAVIIDEASGEVLFDHNAHQPLPPASLTKILTAILALEGTVVDAWAPNTTVDYRRMPGSSVMGIVPGDCFMVRDLLYGLMLPSGNDAALAIGRFQAGSDEAFVHLMNTFVERLGLTGTRFTDPHGLGSSTHRSSAYDIAMLARYGMTQHALFREIVSKRSWTAYGDRELAMVNTNSFLGQFGSADGVKTGFTGAAGRTLAASATRDGRRLYAVILNDDNRHATAAALLDWAFTNHSWQ